MKYIAENDKRHTFQYMVGIKLIAIDQAVPSGCVETMRIANNVSGHDMKRLIQYASGRRTVVNREDSWVTTNKYVDEWIINQSPFRREHLRNV